MAKRAWVMIYIAKKVRSFALVNHLIAGGSAVVPTDTLLGVVAVAKNKRAVENVYAIRKRNLKKPCIILIASCSDCAQFGVTIDRRKKMTLQKMWPGAVSVILPCGDNRFSYLHRNTHSLAFRMPKNKDLLWLLKRTGPLIAPSANIEGRPPAHTIEQAQKYFGTTVAYVAGRSRSKKPSLLVDYTNTKPVIIQRK